jgi:hypothetical protein
MNTGDITEKNHAFREPKGLNRLTIIMENPHNEAIIDENRLEQALRLATGVPDLVVKDVEYMALLQS